MSAKRAKRLAAALERIEAQAHERYPDEGSNSQRYRAEYKRDAFVKGALWWRYQLAADSLHAAALSDHKEEQK